MCILPDAPSAPGGPLEATDIKATEITLAWKPPPDDGGAKIEKYILEKKPKGSNRWQKVPGMWPLIILNGFIFRHKTFAFPLLDC